MTNIGTSTNKFKQLWRSKPTRLLLVVGLLAVVGIAVYSVWHAYYGGASTTDYASCARAKGSVFLDTYPGICVGKNGKRYTDTGTPSGTNHIDISEWGVRLTIPEHDGYYRINDDGTVYITTKRLEALVSQISGCKSGMHGITINRNLKIASFIEPACAVALDPKAGSEIGRIKQDLENSLAAPQQIPNSCTNEPELSASCAKANGVYQ